MQEVLPAFPFKEIPVVYLYVGELGREREVRMSNLVHVAIADKSQVFYGRNGRLSAIIMFCN